MTLNLEEVSLVLFVLTKINFDKYYRYLSKLDVEIETKSFFKVIKAYFEEFPETEQLKVEDLFVYFGLKHPTLKKRGVYQVYLERLATAVINSKLLEENLNQILEKYFASEIVFKLTPVLDGDEFNIMDEVKEIIQEFEDTRIKMSGTKDSCFVNVTINQLLEEEVTGTGLSWRLNCLNKDLGQLRRGTLGHVFARVDTGKTSFIVSEIGNFASQLEEDEIILWCNNEEKGERVKLRIYQSMLNCTKQQLVEYPSDADKEFVRLGGDKIKIYDSAVISIADIEQLLKEYNVRVLVIDQGDKIRLSNGEKDMSSVEKLKVLYGRFRELAKQYNCDILTVGQASATAEGARYLQLDHMDNSKVGKPGELDYAIGIGKITGIEDVTNSKRFISLCKNKMHGGIHGVHEVFFDATRALYSDKGAGEFTVAFSQEETVVVPVLVEPVKIEPIMFSKLVTPTEGT